MRELAPVHQKYTTLQKMDKGRFLHHADVLKSLSRDLSASVERILLETAVAIPDGPQIAAMTANPYLELLEQCMSHADALVEVVGGEPRWDLWWRLRKLMNEVPYDDEIPENGQAQAKKDWESIRDILSRYPRD